MHQAGALYVVAQLVHQGLIDRLRFVRSWSSIRILDARAGLFEHMLHAGTGPRAHIQENRVNEAKRVKP